MGKIYKIEDVYKWERTSNIACSGTYVGWLVSLFATQGLYHVPFLTAYISSLIAKGIIQSKVPKTEEYKRFKEIYGIITEEVVNLTKEYELTTPLEVYALLDIIKANNLLSVNNSRQEKRTRYDIDLEKEIALNNHGVCRHTAAFAHDIYTELGYETSPIIVSTPNYKEVAIEVEIPEEAKKMIEFMKQNIQIEINGETVSPSEIEIGEPTMMEVRRVPEDFTKAQRKHGNHVINRVNYDGLSYNIDTEKRSIYVPNGEINGYMSDEGEHILYVPKHTKKYLKRRELTLASDLPTIPIIDQIEIISKAQDKMIKENTGLKQFEDKIEEPLHEAENLAQLILRK